MENLLTLDYWLQGFLSAPWWMMLLAIIGAGSILKKVFSYFAFFGAIAAWVSPTDSSERVRIDPTE